MSFVDHEVMFLRVRLMSFIAAGEETSAINYLRDFFRSNGFRIRSIHLNSSLIILGNLNLPSDYENFIDVRIYCDKEINQEHEMGIRSCPHYYDHKFFPISSVTKRLA